MAIPHCVLPSASLIDSPEAVAGALCGYFLANADRGDHAVNDELVAGLAPDPRPTGIQRWRSPMFTALTAERPIDRMASTTSTPRVDVVLQQSPRTAAWLADVLVGELLKRRRAIQARANPRGE